TGTVHVHPREHRCTTPTPRPPIVGCGPWLGLRPPGLPTTTTPLHGVASVASKSCSGAVVFFFQAEDGIRDWSVTGVQTCALPISSCVVKQLHGEAELATGGEGAAEVERDLRPLLGIAGLRERRAEMGVEVLAAPVGRSKERRVGKEGRWRGAAEAEKKTEQS